MNKRLLLRVVVSCAPAVALHATAQTTPAAVTDADIASVQQSMEAGCVRRGLERKDPEQSVRAFCGCMTGVLKDQIARADWQQGISGVANGHNEDLEAVLKPHLGALQVCKAKEGA